MIVSRAVGRRPCGRAPPPLPASASAVGFGAVTTRAFTSILTALALAGTILVGPVLAQPAVAGEVWRGPCPQDAPPGVRLPDRPGCRERAARENLKATAPGSIDLGGGTSLRIGGRVRADYDLRR